MEADIVLTGGHILTPSFRNDLYVPEQEPYEGIRLPIKLTGFLLPLLFHVASSPHYVPVQFLHVVVRVVSMLLMLMLMLI